MGPRMDRTGVARSTDGRGKGGGWVGRICGARSMEGRHGRRKSGQAHLRAV